MSALIGLCGKVFALRQDCVEKKNEKNKPNSSVDCLYLELISSDF